MCVRVRAIMFRNNRENRERLTVDKPEMQRIILCAVQLDGEFCCQCELSKSLKIHILIKQLKDQILIPYLMHVHDRGKRPWEDWKICANCWRGGGGAVILEHSEPVPTWVMKSDWGQISSKCLTTSPSPQFYMWAKLIRLGNILQAFAEILTQFFSL